MAIYKIYPEKDTTIYSAYPTMNTGLDQILEVLNQTSSFGVSASVSRALIQFPSSVINDVIASKVGNSSYEAYLKMFVANATQLPDTYTLDFNPISGSWNEGTGRYLYNPSVTSDCTWIQRENLLNWATGSLNANTNAIFLNNSPGGGVWYTNYTGSQTFTIDQSKDIDANVTSIVRAWRSGSIPNNGIIISTELLYEFNTSSSFDLKYFSKDTHTIYPPQLEIRWDDSSYNTGSLTVLANDNTIITLGNNIGQYNTDTTYQFRVNARQTYPARQFVTQSVYTLNNALPSSSYYAVQDLDTGEYVVDFSVNYTKISCDSNGNYFKLYMAAFQPERYYKILIKSSFADGSTVVFDNNYTFKINK